MINLKTSFIIFLDYFRSYVFILFHNAIMLTSSSKQSSAYDNATKTWGDRFARGTTERTASEYADSLLQEVYLVDPYFKGGEHLRNRMYDKLVQLFRTHP